MMTVEYHLVPDFPILNAPLTLVYTQRKCNFFFTVLSRLETWRTVVCYGHLRRLGFVVSLDAEKGEVPVMKA